MPMLLLLLRVQDSLARSKASWSYENVAKVGLVALRGAAGDMGPMQPPSRCCHEGEEGLHVDQPKGTVKVCVRLSYAHPQA